MSILDTTWTQVQSCKDHRDSTKFGITQSENVVM